jgi:hypothetical protein
MLLVAFAAAFAGTPVLLPPTERPEVWAAALALAGLEPGLPGEGPWVAIVPNGARWRVRLADLSGAIRELDVDVATTAAEREELAWLLASLLRPMAPVKPAPTPVEPPAPKPAKPAPTAIPPARVGPPPVLAPLPPPPPPPRGVAVAVLPSVSLGAAAVLRPGSAVGVEGWLDVEISGSAPFSPVVSVSGVGPASVDGFGGSVRAWSVGPSAGASWRAAESPVPVRFVGLAGVQWLTFADRDGTQMTEVSPVFRAQLGLPLDVGTAELEPAIRLEAATTRVDLFADRQTVPFGDWALTAGLAGRLRP